MESSGTGIAWRPALLAKLSSTERTVFELVADPTFETEGQRVQAFTERTAKCRATYFNIRKRLGVAV